MQVDVLIASAPHADTFGYSMPPPGLLRLGGALERAGVSVALEDLAFRLAEGAIENADELARECAALLLADGGPRRLLGLSCMGATLPAALAIAAHVRTAAPQLTIAIGGPGVTQIEHTLLERFPALQVVVRGEGEVTVVELVERLVRLDGAELDLAGVDGLSWRDASGRVHDERDRAQITDLADLPPAAWHLVASLERYKGITGGDDGLVPVDSGRGCVYDCSFCSIGRTWRRRSRTVPVARLVDEMLFAAALPRAKQVYLCHDIFGADRKHALALCAELERRGAPVPFEVRARVDHLDAELAAAMGRAGCYRVLLGIETGDAALRNRHGKHIDEELDVLERIVWLDRAGVTSILSLVLGLPGEGDVELVRTLDLCLDAALAAPVNLSLHLPNPQPACRLGEEDGGRSLPVEGLAPDMAFGAGTSPEERALVAAHPDLFGTFAVATAGGVERAHWLRRLADELPAVLMRFPRTYALLARTLGRDVLGTRREWEADGRSFESFALARGGELVAGALRWEQAIVRIAALGTEPPRQVRAAVVVDVAFDPLEDPRRWREGPLTAREPRRLAVAARGNAARTVTVKDSLADLLVDLDGRALDELQGDTRLSTVLPQLVERGLVTLPATATPAPTR